MMKYAFAVRPSTLLHFRARQSQSEVFGLIKLLRRRAAASEPVERRFEPLAHSAFRTLGLAATATQSQVFDAAASVRLALKLGVRKSFAGDLDWLEPLARGDSEARDALGRLSEPAQRARERLFWFHGDVPPRRAEDAAQLMGAVDDVLARGLEPTYESSDEACLAEAEASALHDAALLALAGLVRLDPSLTDGDAWARAFALWRRLVEREEFWSLLVAADLKGGFEQSVTFHEVAELRARTPRLVSAYAADRARDAALAEDARTAARVFGLLRGAGLPPRLLKEYEREACGPLEDSLTEKLGQAFAWTTIDGFDEAPAATRRNYANEAWRSFDRLRPSLADFAELAGADSFQARHVFGLTSSKLLALADSFEAAERRGESLFICLKAWALAPPGCEEATTAEERLRTLGAAEELRERTPEDYAASLARELADARVPRGLFRDDPDGEKPFSSYLKQSGTGTAGLVAQGDGAGCLTSIIFWLVVAVSCLGLERCGIINMRPTRTPIETLPRINFTPPPPPNLNLNLNYNLPPLNLNLYRVGPPATVKPRERRRTRRRPSPNTNEPTPPRQ